MRFKHGHGDGGWADGLSPYIDHEITPLTYISGINMMSGTVLSVIYTDVISVLTIAYEVVR